jgi:two-component system response regulator FixJ
MTKNAVVHVIDDDPLVLFALEGLLDCAGFFVNAHASVDAFLTSVNPGDAGCVVTDVRMPGTNGLELLRHLADEGFDCPVIVITGHATAAIAAEAAALGAAQLVEKPFAASTIIAGVRNACAAGPRTS